MKTKYKDLFLQATVTVDDNTIVHIDQENTNNSCQYVITSPTTIALCSPRGLKIHSTLSEIKETWLISNV